ncbi:MAG: hypothetical protein QHI48_08110 [Bacteroidota bacterium]|nr:hypothetical protein [Bacteroidota bacterium]
MVNAKKSEDRIYLAERMVDALRESMSILAISKATGVSRMTVTKIAKGDAKRLTEKVFQAIKKYYDRTIGGEPTLTTLQPKPQAKTTPAAVAEAVHIAKEDKSIDFPPTESIGSFVSLESIQAEITVLERRLEILKKIAELAKEL